ncbi:MAG: GtrA family protein [Caldilinea sp. CFX5]|nr:GtrA family protein [Caldilinea sp. CFX5]
MHKKLKELKRFVKFGIVGSIGAVVHFSILNLSIFILSHNFSLDVKLSAQLSNPLAFLCAVTSNFLFNRFWTFPESRKHHIRGQFLTYTAINTIGLGINQLVFATMINWITPNITANALFAANISLLVAIAIVFFWNYSANRKITYSGL